jgi:pimeloyl-ACP methyl ester carboxylesterase
MRRPLLAGLALTALAATMTPLSAQSSSRPTIVLVHGAFAGSDSWNGVITELKKSGFPVIAAANPLRTSSGDAASISALIKSIPGPVVLVSHSYGGTVTSQAAVGQANVKSLVYVASFAPEAGETTLELNGKFPGSQLGDALTPPVVLADGSKDNYVDQAKFAAIFAADVPATAQVEMAVGQRPFNDRALTEVSGPGAWKTIPSWFIYGTADQIIPPATHAWMAERAKARKTIAVKGGSHVVMVSHPKEVAALIVEAAR